MEASYCPGIVNVTDGVAVNMSLAEASDLLTQLMALLPGPQKVRVRALIRELAAAMAEVPRTRPGSTSGDGMVKP
jgi:hypothetical protein